MNENIYSRMSSVFNVGNKSTEETLIESGKATGINDDVAVVAVSPALDNCQNYTETNNSSMNQKSESSIFPDEAVKFSCTHFELQPNPKTKELSLKEFEDLIKSQNMSSDEPKRKRKRKRSLPSKIVNSSENFQTEKNPRYLTHDQRMEIIELCQQKNSPSKRELGRMFNVSDAAIRKTLLKKEEILKLDKEINGEKNLDRIENNTNLIISDSDLIKSSTEHSFTALPAIKVKKLLSLGQKLEIISLLLSSKLQTEVENQFDVTRECIDEIWVKRHDILMKASQKLSDVYSDEKSEQSSNENSVDSVIDKPIEKEPFVSPPSLVSFQNASLNFTPDLSKPILKPNYTRLTIAQKLEIIKILCEPCQGKKPSMRKVGKMYGVTDGSIRKVVRDKETIIANSKLVNEEFKNTRTKFTPARDPIQERIEDELYNWIVQMRFQNLPVSPTAAIQRAKLLASEQNCTDFKASWNWFKRYRDRKNMRLAPLVADGSDLRIIMDMRDAYNRDNPQTDNTLLDDRRFNSKLPKMKLLVRGVDFE